jgi:hypothetical protein
MALDSRGNPQIDFVWGNMPMQPNYDYDTETTFRRGQFIRPGDGEAEFYVGGHATSAEWGNADYFPGNYMFPSEFLDGQDSHNIALRYYNGFMDNEPNSGNLLTVNWWETTPAMQFPNIVGKTVPEALASLRNAGVAENFLGDFLTNATNPYEAGEGTDAGWLPDSGIVIWRYLDPDYVIGNHWDGSPWLASEAEGLVIYTDSYPANYTAVGSYYDDGEGNYPTTSDPNQAGIRAPYWLTFCAIQTTDPNKNSWNWWN